MNSSASAKRQRPPGSKTFTTLERDEPTDLDLSAAGLGIGVFEAPEQTFKESVRSIEMYVDGKMVADVEFRYLDDHKYGPGYVIDFIETVKEQERKGHGMTLLKRLHAKLPDGVLFATDTTNSGERLRMKYEKETGETYINLDIGEYR